MARKGRFSAAARNRRSAPAAQRIIHQAERRAQSCTPTERTRQHMIQLFKRRCIDQFEVHTKPFPVAFVFVVELHDRLVRRISQICQAAYPGQHLRDHLQPFAFHSSTALAAPVTLPPGWARLWMRPVPIGSPTPTITTGIVAVAFFRASTGGVLAAISTWGFRFTNSAASPGSSALLSLAERKTIVRFRPC